MNKKKKKEQILFSIIIPLYNKENYITETLESISRQKYDKFEIIIVDDGSTDNSLNKAKSFNHQYVNIFSIKNSGVSAARNFGILKAKGNYICFLDADDLWSPQHLQLLTTIIEKNNMPNFVSTGYTAFTESKSIKKNKYINYKDLEFLKVDRALFYKMWINSPFFWTGSISIKSSFLKDFTNPFPLNESLGEDQDLWFKLMDAGHLIHCPVNNTAYYRQNVGDSLTSHDLLHPLPSIERLGKRIKFWPKRDKTIAEKFFRLHYLHLAWSNCINGNNILSINYLIKGFSLSKIIYIVRIMIFLIMPLAVRRAIIKIKG